MQNDAVFAKGYVLTGKTDSRRFNRIPFFACEFTRAEEGREAEAGCCVNICLIETDVFFVKFVSDHDEDFLCEGASLPSLFLVVESACSAKQSFNKWSCCFERRRSIWQLRSPLR